MKNIKSIQQLTKNRYLNMYKLDVRNEKNKKLEERINKLESIILK